MLDLWPELGQFLIGFPLLFLGSSLLAAGLVGRWWGGLLAFPVTMWIECSADWGDFGIGSAVLTLVLLALPSLFLKARATDSTTGVLKPKERGTCLTVGAVALTLFTVVMSWQ